MLNVSENPREVIGANNPPGPLSSAHDAMTELSAWLAEHPVIQSPSDAKEGGAYVERTRIALSEARAERDTRTRPHNDALKDIRAEYDLVREKTKTNAGGALETAYGELKRRLTDYAQAVEAARIAEAERLRAEAAAKEAQARQAEKAEQDAIAAADVGECSDVGAAIVAADSAFATFKKADRAAVIAERAVPVRIGSIMGNASLSMRTTRKLIVASAADACAAINAIGLTERVASAIVMDARLYEDAYGELPPGVTETWERGL